MKSDLHGHRILHLPLKQNLLKQCLKVKKVEYRNPSKWLLSQLLSIRDYDFNKIC